MYQTVSAVIILFSRKFGTFGIFGAFGTFDPVLAQSGWGGGWGEAVRRQSTVSF